jgi:hypothetical protein
MFKHRDYSFFNMIKTDGVGCSLVLVWKKYANKQWGKQIDKDDKIREEPGFTKLESSSVDDCGKYTDFNKVGLDPEKRSIFTMVDEKGNRYHYTACRRRHETYTKRSAKIFLDEKKKEGIIKADTFLSQYNSRTLNPTRYKSFVAAKTIINDLTKSFYV